MKKSRLFLLIFLCFLFSNNVLSQIEGTITEIKTNKTIPFSEIFTKYKLDKEVPTLVITWSGTWCYPCIRLINRYNNCDPSMLNLITINVDSEDDLKDVLREGHHLKWDNAINFHANLNEEKSGFNRIFNTTSAPLILIMKNGAISDALINYSIFPYVLLQAGRFKDIKFIWNSSEDLNSIAWNYYKTETDRAKLEEAKRWVIRSIDLNENYHNTDTYAALLFKTENYTEALKMAKRAIELAKKDEIDYDSTTELINQIIEKL